MAETFLAFKDTVRALEAVRNTEDFLFNTIKNKVIFHRNTVHYLNQVVIESDVDMNTESNEICPVIIEGEVWYASDKAKSIVDNEEYGWTGQGYLSIYNQKGSVIQGLNSEYHDGPFSVTADGNTMYFSRAMYGKVDGKKQPIPLSIWQSVKQGKKWGTPIEVNLINNDENYSHPAISPKGDFMIFTATGTHETGKELMISYRNGGNWTKPENLGKTINTPFDEVFPVLANDSTLYFSSNGLPGFGGLDIFMVKLKNGKPYQQPRNVYGPINSGADDFHLVYLPEDPAKGYFTTNRSFEKGDDIFGFTIAKMIVGRIVTKRPDALQRTQFTVMQNGKEMATVKADPDGNLILPYLNSPYEVLVQQAAVDGDLSFTQISPEQGVHKFNLIRSDKSILNEISLTDDLHMTLVYGKKDDSSIEGSYVRGCFIEAEGKAKLNTAVIVDVHGNAIDTLPLVDGCITFRKLEGTHSILLPETTDDMELTFKAENVGKDNFKVPVLSATGKPLKFITVSNQSSFVISLKNIDQDKLKELIIENKVYKNVEGCVTGVNNKELIKEMKFALVDEKGNAIDTLYLNEKGCFFIKRLSPDHSLIPLADYDEGEIVFRNRTDEDLTDRKFYIRNKKLEIVDSVYLSKLNRLDMELTSIYQLEAEDVWLDFSLRDTTVIENIYFEYDDYKITLSARRTLNRVVQFLQKNPAVKLTISAHTDSRGNNEYNMILSQNRAKSTMDYLLSKGISKWKIKSAGYGESRLLNNCSDGAECTEEQHAKNRRIEFQIR
jgi:outer membrane protein OmpA-like peptidoglycan-associated protein